MQVYFLQSKCRDSTNILKLKFKTPISLHLVLLKPDVKIFDGKTVESCYFMPVSDIFRC